MWYKERPLINMNMSSLILLVTSSVAKLHVTSADVPYHFTRKLDADLLSII